MKTIAIFTKALFAIAIFFNVSSAQESYLPSPDTNSYFERLVGKYEGSEIRNGMQFQSNVEINWDLNHQFLMINVSSSAKDNPAMSYEGKGIWAVDENGNFTSWWFDIFGPGNVTTGKGMIEGNVLTVEDRSNQGSSNWTLELKENGAVMKGSGLYKDGKGNTIPTSFESNFKTAH